MSKNCTNSKRRRKNSEFVCCIPTRSFLFRQKKQGAIDQQSEADKEISWILAEVEEGSLTFEEGEACLQELQEKAPKPESNGTGNAFSFLFLEVGSGQKKIWYPKRNEIVRLSHLGGRFGEVLSGTPGKNVKIKCGAMTLEVPIWYIEPVDSKTLSDAANEELMEESFPVEVDGPLRGYGTERFQTPGNTIDLRGMVKWIRIHQKRRDLVRGGRHRVFRTND